jgi:hypothetical protein
MRAKRKEQGPARRRGSLTIELLLLLPILFAVLLAVVEFSQLIEADQRLSAASAQGARVAAQGGDAEEVAHAVRQVLGKGRLSQAKILARLTDRDGRPIPSGETVEVVVVIPAKKAVPDLLAFFGFSLGKRELVGQTAMRKE